MKDNENSEAGALRRRDGPTLVNAVPVPAANGHSPHQPNGAPSPPRFDAWMALDFLLGRWHWLVLGLVVGAGTFFLLSWSFVHPKFIATGLLLRYEAAGQSEYFKTAPISSDTFAALMRSPDLLRQVGQQAVPPIPPEQFIKIFKVDPDPDADTVKVLLVGRNPQQAVDLLNLYLTNAVEYTRQLERTKAAQLANNYLTNLVAEADQDIKNVQDQFTRMPATPLVSNRLAQVGARLTTASAGLAKLQAAQSELYELLARYTDQHPQVIAKREEIKALEARIAEASTNKIETADANMAPAALGPSEAASPKVDVIVIRLRAIEDSRQGLIRRLREAELYVQNPPGTVRVLAPADLKTVKSNMRGVKIGLATIFGGGLGLVAAIGLVLLVEFADRRLKTTDDVTRVTHLPVLTSLGNLRAMPPEDRAQWAFRTWTMLQGRLSPSANHGLVCGITSSSPGEGRSTWISLLAEAASLTGFRVLTIATRPSPSQGADTTEGLLEDSPPEPEPAPNGSSNGHDPSQALTTSVLTSPSKVTEQLTGPNSQPVVHIPLPGWVWNLERRKQWREALNQWRQIDNLVILVELPPSSVPEAVLLGSNLPNMIWLSDSGAADAGETRAQLETLRHARCNLVGAVLNRQTSIPMKKRFPRWLGCIVIAGLSISTALGQNSAPIFRSAPGQAPTAGTDVTQSQAPQNTNAVAEPAGASPVPEAAPGGSFSIVNPPQRAAWQQHFTLGPGDVLNFNLYGQPELVRTEVAIPPDGHVSYLQARDIPATGLSIDELREKIDAQLGKYYRAPHTIITPVSFKSKRYFMLGRVATKGVYVLDRPITVLEALARAHGFEAALADRDVYDLTDFSRSFLARSGRRYPLNFEKLFLRGDLSQNIAVEPGDYIYFAPGDMNQVYVVGEVRLPGPVNYVPDLTTVQAISSRGGFTDRAFRARVLVIRGSLNNPDRFVVNTHAVVDGKGIDFKLQPKDVIYVNSRPFILVEEAADMAMTAFIQSLITSWVGVDVVKPIP